MIAETAQDLITRVKAITSNKFGVSVKRVGLAAGGTAIDPTMEKVEYPAAWVIYVSDQTVDPSDQGSCGGAMVKLNFVVKIIVNYDNEKDLIDNQYPLLVEVIRAVNGQQGPTQSKRWKYEGQSIDELTSNRIVFDQRYSISTIL